MYRQMIKMMKNAGKFLKYPLLQYIPISIRTLSRSENWSNPYNQPNPQFLLFQDPQALQSALGRYQISPVNPPERDELFVLVLNFRAETVLFRYLTCKIIGQTQMNSCHVFAITKRYFPKRQLHFVLYENTGVQLKWLNQEIY